jgi:hypothetical protein
MEVTQSARGRCSVSEMSTSSDGDTHGGIDPTCESSRRGRPVAARAGAGTAAWADAWPCPGAVAAPSVRARSRLPRKGHATNDLITQSASSNHAVCFVLLSRLKVCFVLSRLIDFRGPRNNNDPVITCERYLVISARYS